MRPMTVKQAEKWLEKMKASDQNSFKELSKILKKYEKNSDDYECFIKLNTVLLEHPDLTIDINGYLEEGNKFIINQSEVEKINDLVKYIRKVDANSFIEIANYITKLHSERKNSISPDLNEDEMNKLVKKQVLNEVNGKPELEAYARKALSLSAEEMIKELNLTHLKNSKNNEPSIKQHDEAVNVIEAPVLKEEPIEQQEKPKMKMFPPFLNQNEEKYFFRQFEANSDPLVYDQILKIISVFELGIISKEETLELLKPHCQADYAAIKDIVESREADRRRNCCFRPLIDIDYSNSDRVTHSYVRMPDVYPHYCSNKTSITEKVLNNNWVTVPRGTEETFNLRIKNSYEENLIRAEDDRYEFDIYRRKLSKTIELVDNVVEKLKERNDADVSHEIQTIVSLGIIQILYKNSSKEQREEFEFQLRNIRYDTITIFQSRLKEQQGELQDMRSIHGLRTWNDVANKNWKKSLDLKGHEFKRIEKMKMKAGVFLDELKIRVDHLKSRGQNDSFNTPFEGKKEFFSILNSFETSSRKEKCLHRNLSVPKFYDIKNHPLPTLLPSMILAFEDESVMEMVYSYVTYYLDHAVGNETEKSRCRATFKQIMSQFFGINNFTIKNLSEKFEEEKLFAELGTHNSNEKIDQWIESEMDGSFQNFNQKDELEKTPTFNSFQQCHSEYSFEPPKEKTNHVFYASENFYVFIRFLYALFERIIRMKEVISNPDRNMKLFEILYFVCIKSKESAKFEESLNLLFGDYAYLFTTFYKLLESLQKSLNILSTCSLYSYSLRNQEFDSEEIYLLLLNRFILNNNMTGTRLMRFTFEPNTCLLYINSFDSYYRIDEQTKEVQRKRNDTVSKIEIYTLLKSEELNILDRQVNHIQRNEIEYCFEVNSIKMINMSFKEDYFVSNRQPVSNKQIIYELKKNKKFRDKFI